jgi:TPP-dependent pyruvate/acetoin dehydrogenase alpha subunit
VTFSEIAQLSMNDVEREIRLLRTMWRIRMVEEAIAARYAEGKMRCPTHLSTGQEAVPAALAECLRPTDYAVSTHRGHAHYLAKGGSLPAMLAEIYGKVTGCARGRGGSMHLIDTKVGFMGTSAIVGNSIPIGVGLGLSLQLQDQRALSCVLFGDGATEEGAYYESLNFAAVRNLPVLFICENNLYSVYSPLSVRQPPGRSIARVAQSLGLKTEVTDGNDAVAVCDAVARAADQIRAGAGPRLLEFSVYRWREHCGPEFDNHLGYRSVEEFEAWRAREPIGYLRRLLVQQGVDAERLESAWRQELQAEIASAFEFAESSPFPHPSDAYVGEFA